MPHPVAAFVLPGKSDFNALTGFTDEFARCLNNLKIEPVCLDLTNWQQSYERINQTLNEYTAGRIVGAFSFSGVGMELGNDQPDGNIWQQVKIPAVTWMLDHPAYILKRHTFHVPTVSRLYTSLDFVDFKRDYVKSPGRTIHCRMGAMTQGKTALRREPKKGAVPLILLPKKMGSTDEFQHIWAQLPKRLESILQDAVDHYWGETKRWGSVVPSVLEAGRASGIELEHDHPLLCFFIAQIDQYFRFLKANLLVNEVLDLPVRVYGRELNYTSSDKTKAEWLPAINYNELMEEYRNALAVISMNPNVSDDCHDRNYSALGMGALPISDINPWWNINFPELEPYSYNFSGKSVTGAVEKVLDDPHAAAEVAWNVGERARSERPFEKAVEEVVEWAIMQRYFEFEFITHPVGFIRSDMSVAQALSLMK